MESEELEQFDPKELVAEELDADIYLISGMLNRVEQPGISDRSADTKAVQASRDNDQPIEQNYRSSTHTSKNGRRKIAHSKVITE